MSEKKGYILPYGTAAQVSRLMKVSGPEAAVAFLEAIETYTLDGTEPEGLDPVGEILFESMRKEMDIDRDKYEKMCERNRKNSPHASQPSPVESSGVQSNPVDTDRRQKTEDSRQKTELIDSEKSVEPSSPPVATFLLNDGTEFEVTEEIYNVLANTYPALNTMQILREISAWCFANPTYRKTRKGAMRFLNAWFARQQDKGLIPKEVARSGTNTKKMTAEELLAIPAIIPWRDS